MKNNEYEMFCIVKDDTKTCLGISQMPYRKNLSLNVFKSDDKGARLYPLAYFRDKESADEAYDLLNKIYMGRKQ